MTLKAMNSRTVILFLVLSLFLLGLGIRAPHANAASCGAYCQEVILSTSDHEATSDHFVNQDDGKTISFGFKSDSTSKHNVAVGVYSTTTGKLVSSVMVVASGGTGSDTFSAPKTDGYYIRVVCGGKAQTGCSGKGEIEAW
ncbi:hypothetical protein [Paenibacillus popilliae]|uniref:Periplasmic protein n=1 Tax=Paenibacillus popilliae ATCC 14706 TaxID=1212764 RepID=M9M3L0_PAEPP|nr:hypothetical protein [Paenibacillus popilliae]GAC43604.1 periplasmic protein [Paenibacillus popilliae ATCC 14706]